MPLAAILALAPQFISAGKSLFDFVQHVRATAQQTGEWDDAHEAAFQQVLATAGQSPEWKPRE
ncbi:MAG: hypothetical protein EBS05_10150 [Proteobacteria bacterium]|nr:hypothetical protein [Pseudomonadota bacterium]